MNLHRHRPSRSLLLLLIIWLLLPAAGYAQPVPPAGLGVQAFLDQQPGVLKSYRDAGELAATIIESNSLFYGLSPHLLLALLETTGGLLTNPNPSPVTLRYPFGQAGPEGFAAQIEWASRELRAGLGPYERAPVLVFSDGNTLQLPLAQPPEGIALQRFLAQGRTQAAWEDLNQRIGDVFAAYFESEVAAMFSAPSLNMPPGVERNIGWQPGTGFLHLPWEKGTNVVHTAWFDHGYPTVDSGYDGNDAVITYRGIEAVPYSSHDGHDYYFPDQPIGTRILAAAAGIAYARANAGSVFGGNGVVIIHPNGYETVYWHLDKFAPHFAGKINSNKGVWVEIGDFIGTSGATGCGGGCDAAHLHFEVRHYGRQVDPYGWYGAGQDPCERYAGCAPSVWLWHDSLRGTLDFTPPDVGLGGSGGQYIPSTGMPGAPRSHPPGATPCVMCGSDTQAAGESGIAAPLPLNDASPPRGTLSINPPDDLLLHVHFDGDTVQQVGNGFARVAGDPTWHGGRYALGVGVPPQSGLVYPTEGNLQPLSGTLSIWVYVPEHFPQTYTNRHYVVSASANPQDASRTYTGTLALRRKTDIEGRGFWDFWTVADDAAGSARDELLVADELAPGWQHMAITWDATSGSKAIYLNGSEVARTTGAVLPTRIGEELHIGRFTHGSDHSGMVFDELLIYRRVLQPAEILLLAQQDASITTSRTRVATRTLRLDLNGSDDSGGIVQVQIGRDGVFNDPQPYYDGFDWQLPDAEGDYELAVRLTDRAGNTTLITRMVSLDYAPVLTATLYAATTLTATIGLTATDLHQPLELQISPDPSFVSADWQPFEPQLVTTWQTTSTLTTALTRTQTITAVYLRVRDAGGQVSDIAQINAPILRRYLPLVIRR